MDARFIQTTRNKRGVTKREQMTTRYLKITETRYGRTIECWVHEKDLILEDKTINNKQLKNKTKSDKMSKLAIASMCLWGALGVYIGNVLFISI